MSRVPKISGQSLRTEYDAWHERVFRAAPEHEEASSPWYQLVREEISDVSGQRILEVACGRGGYVKELASAGALVTGCDFSYEALRIGHEKLLGAGDRGLAMFVQGDAQALPFADESFDIVGFLMMTICLRIRSQRHVLYIVTRFH